MIKVFASKTGQEEIDEVTSTLKSQWLGLGPKVDQFEKELAKRNRFKSVVMTDSCSNSLYSAIKLFNFPAGSEIILPSLTFVSCAHAIVLNNCVPVFCDVDYDTMNCNINTIASLVTNKTAAIMIVHYGGLPVNVKPIIELGIPIIEDAACAIDSKINDDYCGSFGDVGCFSFDSMKNLSAGEGGAVVAASPTFLEKMKRLRYCGIAKSGIDAAKENKGRWWETEVAFASIRQMPNDIIASIALSQLRKLDILQARRKYIWETYQKEFENINWLTRPVDAASNEQHSFFTYAIKIDNAKIHRDKLAKHLYNKGIYTTLRYFPIHMMKFYKTNKTLKNSEIINEVALNLPIHPDLSDNDLDHIISSIKEFSV
jgi:dTDP-4-amino-4,6-dideoxygalactose transaminase